MLKSKQIFSDKYEWTNHARLKMRRYGLSEQRVKRVIRAPFRYEEGVLEKAIAVMQPNKIIKTEKGKPVEWKEEIWVMYKLVQKRANSKSHPPAGGPNYKLKNFSLSDKKIRVITAWRYPGISPKRDPIPVEIIREVQNLL
ncbi:MAG: hypothetical protein Q8R20_02375 [Nanoarchaeota archaeon]|nr:hypothetical protein [Nanoarchaeota archaeon]